MEDYFYELQTKVTISLGAKSKLLEALGTAKALLWCLQFSTKYITAVLQFKEDIHSI